MSVDPSTHLRFSPHTSYHLSFFLLRVPLSIGGQPAQITISNDGHLAIGCRYPAFSITFDSLITEVDTIVKKYGVEGVSNYWCEDVPLFELKLSSQDDLKSILSSEEKVQNEIKSRIASMLVHKSSDPVVVNAHTEVFMLTPRPEKKDARIIRVSSEKDLDTCTTLWRESEVFNFGALFRAFRTNHKEMTDKDEVTLVQLTKELREVSDWFSLGLHLYIPPAELYDIKHDLTLRSTQEFRTEMLSVWMKKPGASWARVVTALMVIGRETLAHKIALKYGVPVPATVEKKLPQVDTSIQTSMPLQKKLIIQVERRMREVEAKDKELAVQYQSLEEARRQMGMANQRVTETIQSIRQTQTKAINLIQEKMEVEKQLQLKKQELQFLCTIHQDSEQLENIIRNKEEEIRKLQQRLHTVESELSSEKKRSQRLREQLRQVTAELETKSAVEREREKATGDLRTSLERERQTVDFLREQLTSASTSKEHMEHLLSTARCECEGKEQEISQHKLTISRREEEIKFFFQQLQKQKALIKKLDMESAVAREGHSSAKRQLELEEYILKVTDKADELRNKLEEAEERRREAMRKMEDGQVEIKLLQSQMAKLREQQAKVKTSPLQLPLQLRWRRCRDMEYEMTNYPHAVVLQRKVYIGGGYAVNNSDDCIVQVYDIESDEWSCLPRYQCYYFAMTILHSRLTLVGGMDTSTRIGTNQLAVFDTTSQDWTDPYPQMPTPRYDPAVSTYDIWLLVAGGSDYDGEGFFDLTTVELLNTSTKQWLSASPLPMPWHPLMSAILQEDWYIVMNSKQVFRVSLPDIVSQTVDQSTASKSPALWRRLPDTPLEHSTAIAIRGSLLTVGGRDNCVRTDIHLYQPESEKWIKVGDLPTAHHYCSCVLLPSGELLVAGGYDISTKLPSRVDVASVLS